METVVVRCSAREATAEARKCSAAAVVLRPAKEEAEIGNECAGRERADAGVLRRALAHLCRAGQDADDARPRLATTQRASSASVGH